MAHMITGDDFWQVDGRKPAWTRIQGTIVGVGEYPSELWNRVGHPDVERAPLLAWSEQAQAWQNVDTHYAILRGPIPSEDTYRTLGVVSADYTIIQHRELAEALDPLVRAGWQLETAAVLYDGAQMFMTFNSEGYVINQDMIQAYWSASVRHAQSAMNLHRTAVREVCANTYEMGQARADMKISVPHYSKARQELSWAVDVLAKARQQEQQMVEELTALGQTPLTDETYSQVIERAYRLPEPPRRMRAITQRVHDTGGTWDHIEADVIEEYTRLDESYQAKRALVERLRQAVSERVAVFNESRPDFANTGWALWNSITEIESHRRGKNVGMSVLTGERGETMARAYKELVAVAAAK